MIIHHLFVYAIANKQIIDIRNSEFSWQETVQLVPTLLTVFEKEAKEIEILMPDGGTV
jgi:hypothetical protein